MKFIVCLLLVSVYVSQGNAMYNDAASIQAKALDNINKANQQIQETIRRQKEKSEAARTRIENEAKAAGTYISYSVSSNQPGTSYTSYTSSSNSPSGTSSLGSSSSSSSSSTSSSSSSSTVNGVTTTTETGTDGNGNAYSREVSEQSVNGVVQRTVKIWNSETQTYDVYRYTIYPNADPVAVESF